MTPDRQWYNEPPNWRTVDTALIVTSGAKTDFWRVTHYDFIRDSGHFYGQSISGDFLLTVKVIGAYRDLYDQAGVMLRISPTQWIKTGIEWVEGMQYASAVVTRDFSDWSVVALPDNPPAIWLRVKREGDAVEISYALDGQAYTMLRLAYFPTTSPIEAGIMIASPDGTGFEARFEDLTITPVDSA